MSHNACFSARRSSEFARGGRFPSRTTSRATAHLLAGRRPLLTKTSLPSPVEAIRAPLGLVRLGRTGLDPSRSVLWSSAPLADDVVGQSLHHLARAGRDSRTHLAQQAIRPGGLTRL